MGLFDFIGPASGLLFTLENIIWINLGVFIGCVFAAIPGLSVILCIILFLPVTYTMRAIPGMMFLLGIYCAGGYGGSVSAILINTPGTPHAAATMLDGNPLSKMGRTKAALKIALYASTFGGIFSALVLLFLGPQVAKISAQLGTAEYFMVCLFGMTIIAGVSGKSLVKGIIAACLGLIISCVGADPMTSYDRFTFGIPRLYLGLDLAVTLIGLFALVEIIGKAELKRNELNLHAGKIGNENVTDNLLVNPYAGWEFNAYFDFDIKAGFLFAPQRARSIESGWKKQKGAQIDFVMTKWGVKLENNLYLGENLQPFRYAYVGEPLYAGEQFYSTTDHIYNRTWIGYDRRFFKGTMGVEAGMVFHYDGSGMGTQQMVKLSVDIQKLFNIGPKAKK